MPPIARPPGPDFRATTICLRFRRGGIQIPGVKRILSFLCLAAPLVAGAADTNAPGPIKIGTSAAAKHIDETVTVTGKVVQVTFRPKVVFLNFDAAFPQTPFNAVIMSQHTNQFGDLKALEGKQVEVTGKLKEFKDKPEMLLTRSNELQVITTPAQP